MSFFGMPFACLNKRQRFIISIVIISIKNIEESEFSF
jgi:hypothetical protein